MANHDANHRVDLALNYSTRMNWRALQYFAWVAKVQNLLDRCYSEASGFAVPQVNFIAEVGFLTRSVWILACQQQANAGCEPSDLPVRGFADRRVCGLREAAHALIRLAPEAFLQPGLERRCRAHIQLYQHGEAEHCRHIEIGDGKIVA